MEDFLHHLKAKAYQNRKIAFVENGSWAPTAARQMKAIVEGFKNIECVEPVVTIKSTLNEASEKQMDELVAALTRQNYGLTKTRTFVRVFVLKYI